MPSITLHTNIQDSQNKTSPSITNPLPSLVRTPSGLALLEIQGTIHAPFPATSDDSSPPSQIEVGRLEFPLYDPSSSEAEGKWMKKVYLYVGKHQRLVGEVKKIPKAIAVIRKRVKEVKEDEDYGSGRRDDEDDGEALEIVEIVRWKILFAGRPEPVGGEVS